MKKSKVDEVLAQFGQKKADKRTEIDHVFEDDLQKLETQVEELRLSELEKIEAEEQKALVTAHGDDYLTGLDAAREQVQRLMKAQDPASLDQIVLAAKLLDQSRDALEGTLTRYESMAVIRVPVEQPAEGKARVPSLYGPVTAPNKNQLSYYRNEGKLGRLKTPALMVINLLANLQHRKKGTTPKEILYALQTIDPAYREKGGATNLKQLLYRLKKGGIVKRVSKDQYHLEGYNRVIEKLDPSLLERQGRTPSQKAELPPHPDG